jgi:hypothetical protein
MVDQVDMPLCIAEPDFILNTMDQGQQPVALSPVLFQPGKTLES